VQTGFYAAVVHSGTGNAAAGFNRFCLLPLSMFATFPFSLNKLI
jgi:hypothetical protein